MQKITRKKIIVIAIIVITAVVFFNIIRSCNQGSADKYEYSDVTLGKVEKTITVTGILEVSDMVTILSKAAGVMENILVDYNQEVKKGQLLAIIDAKDIDQRLNKIVAQLESAKLEQIIAKEDLESKRSMFKENLISEKGMERAEFNYKSAQLRFRQILIDYDITKTQKGYTRITAPVGGIVIKMNAIKDAPVMLNSPVFMIAPTMKKMILTVSIDETDIGLVKKGQHVSFTVSAFQDKAFSGKIEQVRISPVVRGGLVTYDSIVSCDNSEQILKPGMTATATIEINKIDKVLRVPNQALLVNPVEGRSDTDKTIVWRKVSHLTGKLPVEKVAVAVGIRGDNFTEIKNNLKIGDKVLTKYIKSAKGSKK
jgi:HlyD family secretion protein